MAALVCGVPTGRPDGLLKLLALLYGSDRLLGLIPERV